LFDHCVPSPGKCTRRYRVSIPLQGMFPNAQGPQASLRVCLLRFFLFAWSSLLLLLITLFDGFSLLDFSLQFPGRALSKSMSADNYAAFIIKPYSTNATRCLEFK